MNRAARRQQDRAKKKAEKKGDFQMQVETIQPWADSLFKITLPPSEIGRAHV